MTRPIRFWLSLGLSILVGLSVATVLALLLGVLLPRIEAEVEARNRVLGEVAASQIERFLSIFTTELDHLNADIATRPELDTARLRIMLDTLANADPAFETLYVLDEGYRIVEVGLTSKRRALRDDLIGNDLSGREFIRAAHRQGRHVWSETYLSGQGHVVVGLAMPLAMPQPADGARSNWILVGELDLRDLSQFTHKLGQPSQVLPIIVDGHGNILGHPEAERGLRQENIGHLPFLRGSALDKAQTVRFSLDGTEYIGRTTPIPGPKWTALVAQPAEQAYAIVNSTLIALAIACLLSLLLALLTAAVASRLITRRVGQYAAHMQAIADGDYQAPLPQTGTAEFDQLARTMRRMANSVLERESSLRDSEARFRDVANVSADWIWEINANGRYTYASDSISQLLGYFPEEVIGKTPFDLMPPDEAKRIDRLFAEIAARGESFRDLENIVLDRQGRPHITLTSGSPVLDTAGRLLGYRGVDRDITEQRRAEEAQRLAATVFSASAEGICITDADQRIVSVNPALVAITGYDVGEILGKTPSIFRSGRQDSGFYREMWARIHEAGRWSGEIWNRRKSGEVFPEWLTVTAVRDQAGTVTHYIGSFFDLSERKQQELHIQFLAQHDPLTKLPNRALLDDRIRQSIALARRSGEQIALLFLDLDRFKLINDTLGHDVGDRLLESVAATLRGCLRETETVARLGGDEFVIVIPELTHIDRVALIAKKLLKQVAAPIVIDGRTLHVTASIGVSIYPEDGADAPTLLRNADTAMYHAKEHGRNNYQFFTVAMNRAVRERVEIENDLRLAIERGEFELHYQPQVHGPSGRITGMEALIRWRHPTHGLVPPDHFIPIAEETGLIDRIGTWVLNEACRQARRWHAAGQTELRMGVNLSARQLVDPNLYDLVAAALAASGIRADLLELEITESMLMTDPEAATRLLHRLTELGIRIAIDDFGTGYSSLAYLKHFPVNRLKIDRSFVRDLSSDPNDAAIVKAVVAMAGSLNLEVIAEGVETSEQLHYLTTQGCHAIQGYYFSRPLPAGDFDANGFVLR